MHIDDRRVIIPLNPKPPVFDEEEGAETGDVEECRWEGGANKMRVCR